MNQMTTGNRIFKKYTENYQFGMPQLCQGNQRHYRQLKNEFFEFMDSLRDEIQKENGTLFTWYEDENIIRSCIVFPDNSYLTPQHGDNCGFAQHDPPIVPYDIAKEHHEHELFLGPLDQIFCQDCNRVISDKANFDDFVPNWYDYRDQLYS